MGNMAWGLPSDLSDYKIEKNSDYLKIIVASYFRFRRNCDVVCTEFEMSPKNRADVVAVKDGMLIEVECKTSKADLKNEFSTATKQKKHFSFYNLSHKSKYYPVPNYYYIIITKEMAKDNEVIGLIHQLNPGYGILIEDGWQFPPISKYQAKKIHDNKVSDAIVKKIYQRLCTDNITLRRKFLLSKQKIKKEP